MNIADRSAAARVATANTADLTVVGGAGHVGIPLVLSFAAKGLAVNINDINEQTLAMLKSGRVPFIENDAQPLLTKELRLHALIRDVKEKGGRIVGISAPSRASTLVNYVGLDEAIIDCVCEVEGSLKIGKCMSGTLIPVVEESRMFVDQPECAIIFSWHIADELAPKLRAKGYKGLLVTPLPVPRVL